jgi:hypothetical protein
MPNRDYEAKVGLKTQVFQELEAIAVELRTLCPVAYRAIRAAVVELGRGNPWTTTRYLGEAVGAIDVYHSVAKVEGNIGQRDVFANLKTWALTIFSSTVSLLELEWKKATTPKRVATPKRDADAYK